MEENKSFDLEVTDRIFSLSSLSKFNENTLALSDMCLMFDIRFAFGLSIWGYFFANSVEVIVSPTFSTERVLAMPFFTRIS